MEDNEKEIASQIAERRVTDDSTSSESIELRSQSQTTAQFSSFFIEHRKELIDFLRSSCGNGPPEPEDIAQQAFIRLNAHEALENIKNIKAYLWRTARNLFLSQRRDLNKRERIDFELETLFFANRGAESSPERVLLVREQLRIINEALKQMPETRRKAFVLNRVDGLKISEVARVLNMTRNGALKHIVRASSQIEEALMPTRDIDNEI
ncbi:MAG: RNA polymerase sigma factor [Pseudomonadota bacterium]